MSDKKGESGSAGSIRAAGGSFAKMEIAHEEEYFYKQVSSNEPIDSSFILFKSHSLAPRTTRWIEEQDGQRRRIPSKLNQGSWTSYSTS